jgi:cadmium resistance protein CadD (predicted permease)
VSDFIVYLNYFKMTIITIYFIANPVYNSDILEYMMEGYVLTYVPIIYLKIKSFIEEFI